MWQNKWSYILSIIKIDDNPREELFEYHSKFNLGYIEEGLISSAEHVFDALFAQFLSILQMTNVTVMSILKGFH